MTMRKLQFFALALVAAIMALCSHKSTAAGVDVKTYIPKNAYSLLPTLKLEVQNNFGDIDAPEYFGGLIEQESCISLTHSRCWRPTSQLKTAREEGAGLGQITRAYNADGSIRFDSLSDLRKAHMAELKELSWSNVYQRPDLQMRGIILMSRDNWKGLFEVKDPYQRRAMMDASYNAGIGRIKKMRLQCGLTKNCNPQVWFGSTNLINTTGTKALYGDRTAFMIMNEHVDNIFQLREDKYKPYFRLGDPDKK